MRGTTSSPDAPLTRESLGWTGGQYSILRVLLGVVVSCQLMAYTRQVHVCFIILTQYHKHDHAVPWCHIAIAYGLYGLMLLGFVLAILLLVGQAGRAVTLVLLLLLYPLLILLLGSVQGLSIDLAMAWALLLFHLATPPAPFGSLAARGRVDPDNHWRLPSWLYGVMLAAAGLYHLSSGGVWLGARWSPALEEAWEHSSTLRWFLVRGQIFGLVLGVLWVERRWRPWVWLVLTGVIFYQQVMWGNTLALLMLHMFIFNPAWLPPRKRSQSLILLYDGDCGLCHATVRFVIAQDQRENPIRVAALQGETSHAMLGPRLDTLPDSVVILDEQQTAHVRSQAVILLLDDLGGLWRLASCLLRGIPRPMRDAAYDALANRRKRWFGEKTSACPLLPDYLRARFLP